MVKKSIILLMILTSFQIFSRPLTTRQMRENTLRINAMEVEIITPAVTKEEQVTEKIPEKIVLNEKKLLFDFDDRRVKEQYYGELHKVVQLVQESGTYIKITGYTDSKGSDEYNDRLSYKRAESVYEKLIEFGMDKNKVAEVKGMGKRNPCVL